MSHFECEDELREARKIAYDVDPLIVKRWSPRAFTGKSISEKHFRCVLEAGRLAPSCANSQPWRIIYAHRETPDWDKLFDLLLESNQAWVKECGILMLFLSSIYDDKQKAWGFHSFDTGACWASMAFQAAKMGTPLHGMGGFDHRRAEELFAVGDKYKVEAMAAMGYPGNVDRLSETNQAREKPNGRKSIGEIAIKANQASDLLA